MRRFRRVRGRRFSRRGVVRYGTVRSCPALRCPGTGASRRARDLPSGKPPFSAFPRFAVWKTALLGAPSARGEGRARGPAPIGGGSRSRPRSRARRRAPRPPVPPRGGHPRREPRLPGREKPRTPTTAGSEARGRPRASVPERGGAAGGSDGHAGCSRGTSDLPSAEKNAPLGESPQLTVSF